MPNSASRITEVVSKHERELLDDWLQQQLTSRSKTGRITDAQLRDESQQFLHNFATSLSSGNADVASSAWSATREQLNGLSASRAKQGFTPSETTSFIFSLKKPLLQKLRQGFGTDVEAFFEATTVVGDVLDKLGIYTTEQFQKTRESIIQRQQQEMLELSTPVTNLWDGILAVPLIGTLDSARTQVVMESLLQQIVQTGATIAIVDITGVPTVDTLVAQHLLKPVAAARLMGADCIISGIRPQIAQTIVHLGVALNDVSTKATLADAFRLALQRRGLAVVPAR